MRTDDYDVGCRAGRKMTFGRSAAGAVFMTALALSACQQREAPPQEDFGAKVRIYLLEHPQVIEEAVQRLQEQKEIAAVQAARVAIGGNRDALEQDGRDFVANPKGNITVVEFFDYRCGYCKASAPAVLKLIDKNPDVRFVFKQLPVFGGISDTAARVALSEAGKTRSLALYRAFMTEKALDDAAVDRHLRAAGIDPTIARAAGRGPEVQKHLDDTRVLAKAMGVHGTPAFVVGEKLISGADIAALESAINEARHQASAAVPPARSGA